MITERAARNLQPPEDDELCLEINGRADFESQLKTFEAFVKNQFRLAG